MKWIIAIAAVLAVGYAGCFRRSGAAECEYEGLRAKCGEIVLQLNKNFRTGALHPKTEDLRSLIAKEGGVILMDSADLGVIAARFDRDEETLASVLDRLRKHPAVRSADYNWLSVPTDGLRADRRRTTLTCNPVVGALSGEAAS